MVAGDQVVFDLDGLQFTFEKFRVVVDGQCLRLHVDQEGPMNLIFLVGVAEPAVDANRREILNADSVRVVLRLKDSVFSRTRDSTPDGTDPRALFDLEVDGRLLLKLLANYEVESYGTTSSF